MPASRRASAACSQDRFGGRSGLVGRGLAVVIALVAATVSSQGVAPFIYFRF